VNRSLTIREVIAGSRANFNYPHAAKRGATGETKIAGCIFGQCFQMKAEAENIKSAAVSLRVMEQQVGGAGIARGQPK